MRKIKQTKKQKEKRAHMIANLQDCTFNLKKYITTLNKALPDAVSFGKSFLGTLTKLDHYLHNGETQYTNIEQDCVIKDFEKADMLLYPREFDDKEKEKEYYEVQQIIKYMKPEDKESPEFETEVDKYSARDFLKAVELIIKGYKKEQDEKVVAKILEKAEKDSFKLIFKNNRFGINAKIREDFYNLMKDYFLNDLKIKSNTAVFLPTPLLVQFRALFGEENTDRVILNKLQVGDQLVEQYFVLFNDIKVEFMAFKFDKRVMLIVEKDKLKIDINKEGFINFVSDSLNTDTPEFANLDEIKQLKIQTRNVEVEVTGHCHVVGVEIEYKNPNDGFYKTKAEKYVTLTK